MGFSTLAIVGSVLGGIGIGEIVNTLGDKPKAPGIDAGLLPDPEKAKQTAATDQANQRRSLLAAGGRTDVTGGTGVLTGADVSKTTLLGG